MKFQGEVDIHRLLNEKVSNEDLLRMFDLPCNFYFIFEYMYKNKITDERLLQKSWEIVESNTDKMPGDLYYLWYFGESYLFKLTGRHSNRYENATKFEKYHIDKFISDIEATYG